ncbi:short-chain dehydrogenase/reductase [Bdellovibrio sp. ZAP7]|uniref:SDR family oxidoreductase n=1 Tax=Bdellovibrio sp. ZAP7 TaxID=2231053 RepID=UPI001158A48B|nr:SDR family oxidoreductase [Bdellovibrio sp. ZAP7]QDK47080.1 short-chain dehydrogenase/reductase [Bdellovibrio sp. ZAP7]
MKTVLITGCSSGFGLETSKYFLERGWKVIATMRTPREGILPRSENLRILALDVSKDDSIRKAIAEAGPIDALVNNAGIGMLSPLEGTSMESIREVFETNTLGTIAMTQAVLPQFRERKGGVIVNVTSTVTLKSLPLLAVYTASKAAINAFTESVAIELAPFNVRARLVLPGLAPQTSFAANAKERMATGPAAYNDLVQQVMAGFTNFSGPITHANDVAEQIWKAVTEPSAPMRNPAGEDAVMLAKEVKFI